MNAILLLTLLAVTLPAQTDKVDRERLAAAIAKAESADRNHPEGNDGAVGMGGERGRYQIKRATWESITTEAFDYAHNPEHAKAITLRHLKWLERQLWRAHRNSTPSETVRLIALAWKAGIHGALDNYATAAQLDYAQRVTNLYLDETATHPN